MRPSRRPRGWQTWRAWWRRGLHERLLVLAGSGDIPRRQTGGQKAMREDNSLRKHDGTLNFAQMRNFLLAITAMDEIERLAARAEERTGPPAALILMPNRKDMVQ
jgi:hypothetical protein